MQQHSGHTNHADGPLRWWGLATLGVGISMIMVDGTIVNVAVPTIIDSLGITATDAQWINSAYVLVFAALLLTTGRIADIFGRRRMFAAGVCTFVVASILAGQAGGAGTLIAARLLQGLSAATMLPAALSTINTTFRGRDRAIAFGVWGSVIGGTVALGPLLGGWLTTAFTWRWAFYINVPVGLAVLAATRWTVTETTDPNARRGADLAGTLTAAIGFAAIVFALIEGQQYGWWTPTHQFGIASFEWPWNTVSPVPVAAALGLVSLLGFAAVERARKRSGKIVLLDLSLFAIPSFSAGNLAVAIVGFGELGLIFVLPLFLQSALGYSALRTGLILLALALGTFVASPASGRLAQVRGARYAVSVGLLVEVVSVAGLGAVAGSAWWLLVILLFGYGGGVGLATAQLKNLVLADVPASHSGQAAGVQSTSRQLGSALGIAVLGTILVTSLGNDLSARLARIPQLPTQVAAGVVDAVRQSLGATIPGLSGRPEVAAAAHAAFTDATRTVFLWAAGFLFVGYLASLRLPHNAPEDAPAHEPERQERRDQRV